MSRKTFKRARVKKIIIAITLIIACTIVILGLLYIMSLSTTDDIKLASELVRTIATVTTLIIAIALFDRFGMRKIMVERQMIVVIELIEYLRKTSFVIESETMNYVIWFSRDTDVYKENQDYEADKKKQIIFRYGKNLLVPIEIVDAINNLWIPSQIKDKLNFLDFRVASVAEIIDEKKFMIVQFDRENQNGFFRKEEQTFEEFLSNISLLMKSLKKWIEKNADINELNLSPNAGKK